MFTDEKMNAETVELEVQRNTTRVVTRLPWEMAAHNNAKQKVVMVIQVKSMPVMMGYIK